MNLFQIILLVMAVLIVAIWAGNLPGKIEKSKKEKQQTKESIQKRKDIFQELNEDDKEEYVNFLTKLKYMDKIYVTDQGTILNSKPHTFKDFINNQKLPSKLELIWEILADNNVKIKDIIKKIEDGSPYPPDTKVHWEFSTLKVTSKQIKLIEATHLNDDNILLLDNNYPLYIKLSGLNIFTNILHVVYQAGYGYDDKNLDRGHPTRPIKY